MYDRVAGIGGMLHALLPTDSSVNGNRPVPTKYVDQGVPLLLDALLHMGAQRRRLIVSICGGACVISAEGFSDLLGIGERNVLAAQEAVRAANLRVHAQDTGGNAGRTTRLYMANGQVTVKTLAQGERALTTK
jgi:chemotaxis protein CheD